MAPGSSAPLCERVLPVAEAAKHLRGAERTLYESIRRGTFPAAFRIGRRIVVPGAALAALLSDPSKAGR